MIELIYNVDPDLYGVIDGRDLAAELIRDAYKLLTPYVHVCPACADDLFSGIANAVLEELHESGKRKGQVPSTIMRVGEQDRFHAHLEATAERTRALLESGRQYGDGPQGHRHHVGRN